MSEVNTYVVHRSQECLESLSDGTHSVSPEGEEGTTLGNGVESHSGGTIYCAQVNQLFFFVVILRLVLMLRVVVGSSSMDTNLLVS